jgi:hypothetical protein
MKNAVFWDVAPCRSCVNRRFGGTYRLHLEVEKSACEEPARAGGADCSHIPEDGMRTVSLARNQREQVVQTAATSQKTACGLFRLLLSTEVETLFRIVGKPNLDQTTRCHTTLRRSCLWCPYKPDLVLVSWGAAVSVTLGHVSLDLIRGPPHALQARAVIKCLESDRCKFICIPLPVRFIALNCITSAVDKAL